MDRKPQRKGKNSAEHIIDLHQTADREIPVPEGFKSNTVRFKRAWAAYTRNRARSDWLPGDLHALARVCELEHDIYTQQKILNKEGPVLESKVGPKGNPRLRYIAQLTSELTKTKYMLSLHTTPSHKAQVNTAARDEQAARDRKNNVRPFLAR